MAKCSRCGKKGLFLKVNGAGLCADCERVIKFQEECRQLYDRIQSLQSDLADKEAFRAHVIEQAKQEVASELNKMREDACREIDNSILEKKRELGSTVDNLAKRQEELAQVLTQKDNAEKAWKSASNKMERIKELYNAMLHALKEYTNRPAEEQGFQLPYTIEEVENILEPTVKLKFHSMDLKDLRSRYRQLDKQITDTLEKYKGRYTTKANIAIYRLMVIALRAELQNVIYGLKFGKLEDAEKNIKDIISKYLQITIDGNQSIAPTMKKFVGELEYLFLQAVRIEYDYYVKKEQIKEEQRALREQMRQEAEERKRLEEQKKQVENEENKYRLEIENVTEQLASTEDNNKIIALQKRIEELQHQLMQVENKKEEITRLQNGQAGYVYVISNLGSFGNDVFKIGMTRRLEPQERVDELGSASVPFPFDVHSFIFSSDAVKLENDMHKRLNDFRLNKVNLRKEFFKVPLDQLEELVQELEPTAEFNKTMLAEQYHQSFSIDSPEEVPVDVSEYEYDENEDD